MQTYQTELWEEFETMFPDAILTTRTETVVGTYDETDETKRFKRWFLSKLQAREEWLRKSIEDMMRTKCICHGGGFTKTGNYYVCCYECKDSPQCQDNFLLHRVLSLLTPKN